MSTPEIRVVRAHGPDDIADAELEALLFRVYVEGGFTARDLAASAFTAAAVRARGEIWVARAVGSSVAVGMVIVVSATSPARRIAEADEVELHLLAVLPEQRGRGVGLKLVEVALAEAKSGAARAMVLWTQASMLAAQRLYQTCGFVRAPERDAKIAQVSGRSFSVFCKALTVLAGAPEENGTRPSYTGNSE